jgi:hypothetical protein
MPVMARARTKTSTVLRGRYPYEYAEYVKEAKQKGLCHTSLYHFANQKLKDNHTQEWKEIYAVEAPAMGHNTNFNLKLKRIEKLKAEIRALQEQVGSLVQDPI